MPRLGEFVIIVDTREQHPWRFRHPCLRIGLDAGDYTLQGAESKLRIERKGSLNEYAGNCGKDWPRFKDALRKLARYPHRVIICEFELRDVYAEKWRGGMTCEALLGRTSEIVMEMQIPVLFAGKRGKSCASTMLLKYFNRNRR